MTYQLLYAETALAHARLAAIPSERIVNCWPLDRLFDWLSNRASQALIETKTWRQRTAALLRAGTGVARDHVDSGILQSAESQAPHRHVSEGLRAFRPASCKLKTVVEIADYHDFYCELFSDGNRNAVGVRLSQRTGWCHIANCILQLVLPAGACIADLTSQVSPNDAVAASRLPTLTHLDLYELA